MKSTGAVMNKGNIKHAKEQMLKITACFIKNTHKMDSSDQPMIHSIDTTQKNEGNMIKIAATASSPLGE